MCLGNGRGGELREHWRMWGSSGGMCCIITIVTNEFYIPGDQQSGGGYKQLYRYITLNHCCVVVAEINNPRVVTAAAGVLLPLLFARKFPDLNNNTHRY